jgi:thiol-disulfide isomerase/thioredoxin
MKLLTPLLAAFVLWAPFAFSEMTIDAGRLQAMTFPAPETSGEKAYLNLSGADDFRLGEIKSNAVIVEIFSMYCPHCQAEAPLVNELYSLVESSDLKGKVKFVGVGIGNTPFEINVFKEKYGVKFPLFPDDNLSIQKVASEPIRTPTFLIVRPLKDKTLNVNYTQVGRIKDRIAFVDKIREVVNSK